MKIGLLGAYVISNTGDILFSLAIRQAISEIIPNAEFALFSPHLTIWGYDISEDRGLGIPITPIRNYTSPDWALSLDAVIIGGGGLIHTNNIIWKPFFLSDPELWDKKIGIPAAWNGLGSSNTCWYDNNTSTKNYLNQIKRCCEVLKYVSVRNKTTEKFLRKCGYTGDIHVIPDPAILLKIPSNNDINNILMAHNVDINKKIIGIDIDHTITKESFHDYYADFFKKLFEQIEPYKSSVEVIGFPFSNDKYNSKKPRTLVKFLPNCKIIEQYLSPIQTWQLVGSLYLFITGHLHGGISAFTQNVPFLAIDKHLSEITISSKIRDFMVDADLEYCYFSPYFIRPKKFSLEYIVEQYKKDTPALLSGYKEKLKTHYRNMVSSLGLK